MDFITGPPITSQFPLDPLPPPVPGFLFLVSSLLFFYLGPCSNLSWLFVSFWAHANLVYRIVSSAILFRNWWWKRIEEELVDRGSPGKQH